MAENIPPTSGATANQPSGAAAATTVTTVTTNDQPGRPYYESLRTTLRATLDKKRRLDEQLAALEDSIFKTEGAYLEETALSGNIVRGFDGWVKGVQTAGGARGADDRRRGRVRDDDRVFSRSSVSWTKAQESSDSNPTSAAPTPSASGPLSNTNAHNRAHTPSGTAIKTGNKKKRVVDKEDEEGTKAAKRGKITYLRD